MRAVMYFGDETAAQFSGALEVPLTSRIEVHDFSPFRIDS